MKPETKATIVATGMLAVGLYLLWLATAFANSEGSVTPGTVAPQSTLVGCVFNTTPPVATNNQQVANQCDANGRQNVVITPSSSLTVGITPIVSASAEATHVLKAAAGNLYSVYATNLTATAGFLTVLNATAAPGDGAITPLECVPIAANGNASISFAGGPPAAFSTGITVVVTSAATCFTKTTGVITAFIKGAVQ